MNRIIDYKKQETSSSVFVKRILGKEAEIIEEYEENICTGINLKTIHISSLNLNQEPEEKAYLSFYPIEDEQSYLQLTFLSDQNLNNSDLPYQILQITFNPVFFEQWPKSLICQKEPFLFDRSTEQAFTLPVIHRESISALMENPLKDSNFIHVIKKQETALLLLRISLEAFMQPSEGNKLPACSFLSNGTERDKVLEAREIIMSRLDNPITIKELSKSVAINECYLKKGFKAMFGKTIHEFQQYERIEKAKTLIQKNKYSINEVAYKMGFNSHSHFSTSFKRITGIKPCELLA